MIIINTEHCRTKSDIADTKTDIIYDTSRKFTNFIF